MEKEFVPYELAVKLKALGFDEPCFATWNGETLDMSLQIPSDDYFTKAPTFSQCFRWFEEKYDNSVTLKTYQTTKRRYYDWEVNVYGGLCHSKYEAELECIKKLIEIVESKPK